MLYLKPLHSAVLVLSGLALSLSLAAPVAASVRISDGGGSEDGSPLTPPNGAPAPDASGRVKIEKESNEQKFAVDAKQLPTATPPGPFEVWVESGVGTASFGKVGVMTMLSVGNGRWQLTLKKEGGGAPTTLGVADVADLAGRGVQVRDAGGANTYLSGVAPAPSVDGGDDNGGGNGGGDQGSTKQKGEVDLTRPDPAPDADAFGDAELEVKGTSQKFEVHAGKLSTDGSAAYVVMVETAVGAGTFFSAGSMTLQNAATGSWELELKGSGAPPAALQVTALSELTGRVVQVRDGSDATILQGLLPSVAANPSSGNSNSKQEMEVEDGDNPKAAGLVTLRTVAANGKSEIEVRAVKVTGVTSLSVFIESAVGSNTFTNAGAMIVKGKKVVNGRYFRTTKKGDTLPLGVVSLTQLSGRKLQVRDGAGKVKLSALIP